MTGLSLSSFLKAATGKLDRESDEFAPNSESLDRWDTHFIDLCLLCASMSKDPSTKVGAVIVAPSKQTLSMGFNGFPRKIEDHPDRLRNRDQKLRLVVHAEMNAILGLLNMHVTLTQGSTLYMAAVDVPSEKVWGGAPCIRCAVEMIQAGIAEVVTLPLRLTPQRWLRDVRESRAVFEEAGVKLRTAHWSPERSRVNLKGLI